MAVLCVEPVPLPRPGQSRAQHSTITAGRGERAARAGVGRQPSRTGVGHPHRASCPPCPSVNRGRHRQRRPSGTTQTQLETTRLRLGGPNPILPHPATLCRVLETSVLPRTKPPSGGVTTCQRWHRRLAGQSTVPVPGRCQAGARPALAPARAPGPRCGRGRSPGQADGSPGIGMGGHPPRWAGAGVWPPLASPGLPLLRPRAQHPLPSRRGGGGQPGLAAPHTGPPDPPCAPGTPRLRPHPGGSG